MSLLPPDDHPIYQEWLHLEPDGTLDRSQQRRLREHLRRCAECRDDRRAVAELERLLTQSRVAVDPDFSRRVMAALPQSGWEARSKKGWRLAAVVFVLLAAASAALWLTAEPTTDQPLIGTTGAVVELFVAALTAGSGLLAASWRGVGLAIGDVFRGSPAAMIVFGLFVLGVDALFVRYLLRSRARAETRAETGRQADA